MLRKSEPVSLRANVRASLADMASFSVMVGTGEMYFSAFVLAAGLGQIVAGLTATVPMLVGAVMQLAAPAAIRALGSRKRWVVACVAVQGLSFAPLIIAAVYNRIPTWAMFVIISLYWASGLAASPAWNSWMATLLPERLRAGFFAHRSRIGQASVLCGFLLGGFLLQGASSWTSLGPTLPFAALFLTACACRLASSRFLLRQSEPVLPPPDETSLSLAALVRGAWPGRQNRLLTYLFAVQVAVQFSGPYFTPYMLRQIHLSYGVYAMLVAVGFISKAASYPMFGRLARRAGARRLLWIGGIGIVPVAGLWNASDHVAWLIAVQVISGVAWAAYELATALMFFEVLSERERTAVLTSYNLGNALATVVGSFLGAGFLAVLGARPESFLFLFALSTWGRAATLFLLARVPDSHRAVPLQPADAAADGSRTG
jgi:MFS family permease